MRDDSPGEGSGIHAAVFSEAACVPRPATLAGFMAAVGAVDGVEIRDLQALDTLIVRTRNSAYRIVVLRPPGDDILIQGGRFFPHAVRARLSGSSLGGSLLKLGWIGQGFQMEVQADGQCVLTTRVRSVVLEDDRRAAGPF